MRRSEKAKVLEKAYPDIQGLRSPRTSEHRFIHIQTHTHHATTSRGFGWHIHCCVEVTESSTNKQHTHSLSPLFSSSLSSSLLPKKKERA
jgi:hypothetical protein